MRLKSHPRLEKVRSLQSVRVHRTFKTIVPPEPSAEGLRPNPLAELRQHEGGPVVTKMTLENASEMTDGMSLAPQKVW